VDLSSAYGGPRGGFDLGRGEATINGVQYQWPDLFLTGEFTFEAPAVPLPEGGSDNSIGLFAPFVFSGHVIGSYERPVVTPLFELSVTGKGIAAMGFLPNGDGTYQFSGARYTFTDPVPEPATLLLVGSGAAALAARRRRRRRS
jgi:hypothetical protein